MNAEHSGGAPTAPTNLNALADELAAKAASGGAGRASMAIHAAPHGRMSAIVLALQAGSALDEHENPGEAILHCLRGRVRLSSHEVDHELTPGELVAVPQHRHRLDASEDSVVVLSISRGTVA